jgi:nucleoid-associated protein YgaU
VAAGVFVAPPQEPVVSPVVDTDEPAPPSDDVNEAPPTPSPEPPADHIVVKLEKNQTLIHLAKKHLGNGNRFRELLEYNGWTDSDARRLREGQLVKIPVASGATPR